MNRLTYWTGTINNWHKDATSELSQLLLFHPKRSAAAFFCTLLFMCIDGDLDEQSESNEYSLTD